MLPTKRQRIEEDVRTTAGLLELDISSYSHQSQNELRTGHSEHGDGNDEQVLESMSASDAGICLRRDMISAEFEKAENSEVVKKRNLSRMRQQKKRQLAKDIEILNGIRDEAGKKIKKRPSESEQIAIQEKAFLRVQEKKKRRCAAAALVRKQNREKKLKEVRRFLPFSRSIHHLNVYCSVNLENCLGCQMLQHFLGQIQRGNWDATDQGAGL